MADKQVDIDVKDVVVSANLVDETVGCGCGGWYLSLRKIRAPTTPAPTTPAVSVNTSNT